MKTDNRDAFFCIGSVRSAVTLRGLLPGEEKVIVIACGIKNGEELKIVSDAILKGQHIDFEVY